MQVSINGNTIQEYFGGAENLEEVLVKLSKTALPKDHLIGSVNINGRPYTELYPGQSREIPLSKIHDIQVTTVSLQQFAEAAVKDAPNFIARMCEHCHDTADSFRMYDETDAHQKFADLLEALRALIHFINNVRSALGWNFQKMQYQGESVSMRWAKYMEVIDELKNIQEEGDLILLADIIEYEIIPLLEDWKKIFSENSVTQ
ncbi:MAG: hypothetical protein N3B18_02210 [Desulfobacterota bacterium]|nr:hypothetical protein [Thermodesulfobacteriota bacterium]